MDNKKANKSKISKRRLIQLMSAVIHNLNFKGFLDGKIYNGNIKGVCTPGLNCYSCPGAISACPLGSLQIALSELKFKMPLYIIGTLLIFGILFGRAVCAFLCPFGLIQEFLHKIPSPKLKKSKWTHRFSLLKYIILLIFVIFMPLYYLIQTGVATPSFCKYICPAGTLEGGIPLVIKNSSLQNITGALFIWKIFVLMIVIFSSIFVYRFFCRFLCPLGAIYSFFNRYAITGIDIDKEKCVKCGNCTRFCKTDTCSVNDRECIRCGECRHICHHNAILYKVPRITEIKQESDSKKNEKKI